MGMDQDMLMGLRKRRSFVLIRMSTLLHVFRMSIFSKLTKQPESINIDLLVLSDLDQEVLNPNLELSSSNYRQSTNLQLRISLIPSLVCT